MCVYLNDYAYVGGGIVKLGKWNFVDGWGRIWKITFREKAIRLPKVLLF